MPGGIPGRGSVGALPIQALSYANGGVDLFRLTGASGLAKVRLKQRATVESLGAGTWFVASTQMPRQLRRLVAAWQTTGVADGCGWVIGYASRVGKGWRLDETRWSDGEMVQSFESEQPPGFCFLNQLTGRRPDGEALAQSIVGEDGGLQMAPSGPDCWNEATTKKKKKKKTRQRPDRNTTKRNKNMPTQLRSSRPPLAAYPQHIVSATTDDSLDGKEFWPRLVGGGEAVQSGQLVFVDASELPSTEFGTIDEYNEAIDAAPSAKGTSQRHITCTVLAVGGGLHIMEAGVRQPLSTFFCSAVHDAATADMTDEFFHGLQAALAELKPSKARSITSKHRKQSHYFFGNRSVDNQSVSSAGQGPEGGGMVRYAQRKFTWDYAHDGPIQQLVVATKGFRHARHRAMHAAWKVWGGYLKLMKPAFVNEIASENYIAATHVSRCNRTIYLDVYLGAKTHDLLAWLAVRPRSCCG